MIVFIFKRALESILVVLVMLSLTFLLMRLAPGNPFSADRKLPEQILKELMSRYRLDGTISEQYRDYLSDVLRGNLRESTRYRNRTVNEILAQTFPVSATLGSIAFVIAMSGGLALGAIAGWKRGRWPDRVCMLLALGGISLPSYILAPAAILIFGITWQLLPVVGWGSWDQVILPAVCLSIPYVASVARLTRTSLLDVLSQDYIRTASAKGLSDHAILIKHALRPALMPVISYAGPLAANLLTGSIVIETIFKIPGLGPFFINSVLNRDLFVVGGTVLIYGAALVTLNFLADLLSAAIDPRVRQ